MRSTLKIIAAIFCIQFSIQAASAQNKKDFVGIWQFTQFGNDTLNLGMSARGVLKINTDSTFQVVRFQGITGFIITHSGTFRVTDKNFYLQKTTFQLPVYGTAGLNNEGKLFYKLGPDKKTMRVSYTVDSGEMYYEMWTKL